MSYKSVPLGRKRRISSTGDEGEREEDDEVAHGESFQTQRSGHVSDAAGAKAIACSDLPSASQFFDSSFTAL